MATLPTAVDWTDIYGEEPSDRVQVEVAIRTASTAMLIMTPLDTWDDLPSDLKTTELFRLAVMEAARWWIGYTESVDDWNSAVQSERIGSFSRSIGRLYQRLGQYPTGLNFVDTFIRRIIQLDNSTATNMTVCTTRFEQSEMTLYLSPEPNEEGVTVAVLNEGTRWYGDHWRGQPQANVQ
jgi:hypothetical protein